MLLSYAVSEALIPYARLEADSNRVERGQDVYGKYLALLIAPGQRIKNGGLSSEISINFPYEEGDIVRYSWRMMVPERFGADAENRWWLVARWNAQPNPRLGEKAETFHTLNPPLLVGYKMVNGLDTFSLSYGIPQPVSTDAFSVIRNDWTKVDMVVKWSRGNDGYAKLYVNDSKTAVKELTGRNMYTKYHNILKLGSFRSPSIFTEATFLFGDIKAEKVKE